MKELEGSAGGATSASVQQCVRLLRAVEGYPGWHPDVVRRADVLERDAAGNVTRARGLLHVAVGPVVKDFDLVLNVAAPDPQTIKLTRVPHDARDLERFEVIWRLRAGEQTRIDLQVRASLAVPRLLPVAGIGDRIAGGFMAAALRALGG